MFNYHPYLGPTYSTSASTSVLDLDEILNRIVSQFIEPDFKNNCVRQAYTRDFKVFPDPTVSVDHLVYKKDMVLISPKEYAMLTLMHTDVLTLRMDELDDFDFAFMYHQGKCKLRHLGMVHQKGGIQCLDPIFVRLYF